MIRKAFFSLFAALALGMALVGGAGAAPSQAKPGPFDGTFSGTVHAANGSSAPLTVKATHHGTTVEGVATVGNGLEIEAGWCGAAEVPATTRHLSGSSSPGNPSHLEAVQTVEVEGITVKVRFVGDAAPDGKTISGKLIVDVPAICGPDPVITGSLARVS